MLQTPRAQYSNIIVMIVIVDIVQVLCVCW